LQSKQFSARGHVALVIGDAEKVMARLSDVIRCAALEGTAPDRPFGTLEDARETHAPHEVLIDSAHVVEKILDRVLPNWRTDVPEDPTGRWQQHWARWVHDARVVTAP
jgi:hypothetical protein